MQSAPTNLLPTARKFLATILPGLAAFAGRPTSDAAIRRHIAAQSWDGLYTRMDGLNVGIQQFGPTLFLGRAPAPWNRDADLTLAGPDLLSEIRYAFTIPDAAPSIPQDQQLPHLPPAAAPPAPSTTITPATISALTSGAAAPDHEAVSPTIPSLVAQPDSAPNDTTATGSDAVDATDSATPTVRRLFGVYRHFLVPSNAIRPELHGVAAGTEDLETVLRRSVRYTGAGSQGYGPTFRQILNDYVIDVPGTIKAAPFGLQELDFFAMKALNQAHYAAKLAAATGTTSVSAPDTPVAVSTSNREPQPATPPTLPPLPTAMPNRPAAQMSFF